MSEQFAQGCGGIDHFSRRTVLKMAGLSGLSWLTPLATVLARGEETKQDKKTPAKSLIILWLEGAPSQLETFDPHPGTNIAAESIARKTNVNGIQLGESFEQTAEQMDSISLVRSLYSKEGDHERAIYNVKTGFRPDPTLKHPAIGSVICHQTQTADEGKVDIPRHISIVPTNNAARSGYLGDQFDAFKIFDPAQPVPDVKPNVDADRFKARVEDLQNFVDKQFQRKRIKKMAGGRTLGGHNLDAALKMMSSDQLKAFDISQASKKRLAAYGDSAFGRGCLAALQLIQAGVRCVEITLPGWDSHANNHVIQNNLVKILDPALATLIKELKEQKLLDSTMVVCGGEFGRTPFMNGVGGRDHWPHGFSIALAGGGIKGGRVVGATSPAPKRETKDRVAELKDPHPIQDIHATIFDAFGIDYTHEFDTPIGRPMIISEGDPIKELTA
jgi:hypothetical protein